MRPIRLEVEGLTSFRQKVEIDFSSFDLFAITGPTGAGKTSIIDAIIYALYGRTPRLGNRQYVNSSARARTGSLCCSSSRAEPRATASLASCSGSRAG